MNFQKFDFTTGSLVPGTPDFSGNVTLLGLTAFTNLTFSGVQSVTLDADFDNLRFVVTTVLVPP